MRGFKPQSKALFILEPNLVELDEYNNGSNQQYYSEGKSSQAQWRTVTKQRYYAQSITLHQKMLFPAVAYLF